MEVMSLGFNQLFRLELSPTKLFTENRGLKSWGESAVGAESLGTITALPVLRILCFHPPNTISVHLLPPLWFKL